MPDNQLLYPIETIAETTYAKHHPNNMWMDKQYAQTLYGAQSSSAVQSGSVFFDNKFTVDYSVSVSSNYYALAFQMGVVNENNYSLVPYQQFPGIWKTPSLTGDRTGQQVAQRVQQVKLSRYYFGDEIANGSYRMYYLPEVSSISGALSALQTQNVLRFININEDYFGPTFSMSGSNLSGTTSAITVDFIFRPVPQLYSGYLWHRWTTDGKNPIQTYADSATAGASSYQFYQDKTSYGLGCYVNHLTPIQDSDAPKPFIDFYVYGALSSATGHYLDLKTGLINQVADTRFFLKQEDINTLFDGSFHNVRCVWSTDDANKNGRIFLDGNELSGVARGTGRSTPVNYAVSTIPNSSPFYYMSRLDKPSNFGTQTSSINTIYGETKHLMVFDKPITSNFVPPSVSSNISLVSALGASTASLCSWMAFGTALSGNLITDIASVSATTHVLGSLTGRIANDMTVSFKEGSIDRIFGLIHDRSGQFWFSQYDGYQQVKQRMVGKLYNSEYGNLETMPLGALFYDRGNAVILNDHYNTDFNYSTQLFVSSTGNFGIVGSGARWPIQYLSFIGRKYIDRRTISVTATSGHFAKSGNESSYFLGTDDLKYTKSNVKAFTGIVMFGKDGRPHVVTKFSEPVIKPEHHDIVITLNVDM